jgi:hypothetical protein
LVVLLVVPAAPAVASEGCANEARREEQGALGIALPECRAYEMVTPPNKGSGGPAWVQEQLAYESEPIQGEEGCLGCELHGFHGIGSAYAAIDGNRLSWHSDPIPAAKAPGTDYLGTRGADGWTNEDVIPTTSPFNALLCPESFLGVQGPAWSADLSKVVFELPAGPPQVGYSNGEPTSFSYENECGNDEPRLVPGEPEHLHNLFLHDNVNGSNELVNITPEHEPWFEWPVPTENFTAPPWPYFQAASDDLSHIVFEEEIKLTEDAPVGFPGASSSDENQGGELYEWTGGKVRLVTLLPNGEPVVGRLAAATRGMFRAGTFGFYEGSNIARYKHAMSSDGSRIFWENGRDVKGNLEPAQGDLYMRENGLRTVEVDHAEAGAAGSSGGGDFQWASVDGSRAFFTDDRQLTTDSTAVAEQPDLYEWRAEGSGGCAEAEGCVTDLTGGGSEPAQVLGVAGASEDGGYAYFVAEGALTGQPNPVGETATAGAPNLYVAHAGAVGFIATLDRSTDKYGWSFQGPSARLSGNGRFLAFNSSRRLTSYDNTDAGNGKPDLEIYLYDAATEALSCVSCLPGGEAPSFGATLKNPTEPHSGFWTNGYPQHNVSSSGQVFFETTDALVPRDTNGRRDVYEYLNGAVHLLSGGTSEEGTHFLDATPDGSNVFIATSQRLLPKDTDSVYDYYDVRVDGGFAEPPTPPGCELEGCRNAGSEAANGSTPVSGHFEGPGSRKQLTCERGFVKRHGRCVRRKHQKHRRHRKHQKHRRHGRPAGTRGRAGR